MGVAPVPVYAQETKEKMLAKVLAFCFGMAKVKPQETQGHLNSRQIMRSKWINSEADGLYTNNLVYVYNFIMWTFWFIDNVAVRFLCCFKVFQAPEYR